uniref:Uncharacterized protein n=1 Tax=Lygus hesperus TaxID=30085 RepID=A0A146L8Y9_LYGHE
MLIVSKITFLSPRSVKKTTSGKKRRNDMKKALEDGYLNHRIVKVCYTKQFEKYINLCGNNIQISENKVGTGKSHFVAVGKHVSQNIFNHNAKDRSLELLLQSDEFDK